MNVLKKLATAIIVSLTITSFAFAYTSPGKPTGFINDYAKILDTSWIQTQEANLSTFEKQTGAEISIVTIPTLNDEPIENYAVKLFEEWKIGKKGKDNGILILIAQAEHGIRLEIGYGLEGTITDADSSRIIQEQMIPKMKMNNPTGALDAAIQELTAQIKGETSDDAASRTIPDSDSSTDSSEIWIIAYIVSIVIGMFLTVTIGIAETKKNTHKKKYRNWWLIVLISVAIGMGTSFSPDSETTDVFFKTLIALAMNMLVYAGTLNPGSGSGTGGSSGHSGNTTGGSSSGGSSSSSGSSFGGFGGGRSGGGGASGKW